MFMKKVLAVQEKVETTLQSSTDRFTDLGTIFSWIVNLILGIGWGLVIVKMALGFIQYVMSKGEKDRVEGAQQWLTYAAIGGVGLFLLTALKSIIPGLLGASGGPGGNFIWGGGGEDVSSDTYYYDPGWGDDGGSGGIGSEN